jgi:multiple sugar transport system permease protein
MTRPFFHRRRRELLLIGFFLAPSLLILFVYRILPLFWNLVLSFLYWAPTQPVKFAGLSHYEEMFIYDEVFRQALVNTLVYMGSMPLAIALSLLIALAVNAQIRGRNIYRTITFLSYPMMPVAVAIIWQWLYNEKVGLFNFLLRSAGIISEPFSFLESARFALPSVIVAGMWQILGFFMVILLTGLQSIPPPLYEAAAIDGAGGVQRFFRITLPLLRPSIFLCVVISVISTFTSFDLVYVMTGGGPGHATELLITYIYKKAFGLTEFDYAAALTVVMFGLFLIITLVMNRLSGGEVGKVDASL